MNFSPPRLSPPVKLLIGLLAVAYFVVFNYKMLAGPLRFNDDVVQHYLWLFDTNWADDFYARASGRIQPWGYYVLLKFLNLFAPPLAISRYGPLLITLITVGYGVGFLRRFFPTVLAVAGAFLIAHYSLYTSIGFLARAFCTPLLLLFAYYLVRERPWGIAAALVIAAVFYPPALLINGLILVVWELARVAGERRVGVRNLAILAAGGLLAVALVLLHSYQVRTAPELGEFFSAAEIKVMPEFHADGRVAFSNMTNTPTWWMMRYFIRYYFGSYLAPDFGMFVLAVAFLFGGLSYRKLGRLGAYLLLFGLATVGLYHLARLWVPLLFLPDRYVAYPWRMGVPLVITFIAGAVWSFFPRRWLAWVGAAALLGVGWLYHRPDQLPVVDMAGREDLHAHLRSLPEDVMIAGPPQMASWIPLLAQRSVLLSNESAHALYFRNYYDFVSPRYRDYTAAIIAPADSLDRVAAFMDKYAVDYLLVDRRVYRDKYYQTFAPYTKQFAAGTQVRGGDDFALMQLPDSVGVRFGDRLHLVSRSEVEGVRR